VKLVGVHPLNLLEQQLPRLQACLSRGDSSGLLRLLLLLLVVLQAHAVALVHCAYLVTKQQCQTVSFLGWKALSTRAVQCFLTDMVQLAVLASICS